MIKKFKTLQELFLSLMFLCLLLFISPVLVGGNMGAVSSDIPHHINVLYAADYSKDRILVGASHNVFVGRVRGEIDKGSKNAEPETQFEVEIIENIKGKLEGNIIVNQEGGYKDGVLYVVSGEDDVLSKNDKETNYLLQPGYTYIFATRYNSIEDWYTLNPHPNALTVLTNDTVVNLGQLMSLAKESERVKKLKEAYKREILLEADVEYGNTLNSFSSQEPVIEENVSEPTPEREQTVSPETAANEGSL